MAKAKSVETEDAGDLHYWRTQLWYAAIATLSSIGLLLLVKRFLAAYNEALGVPVSVLFGFSVGYLIACIVCLWDGYHQSNEVRELPPPTVLPIVTTSAEIAVIANSEQIRPQVQLAEK